MLLGHGGNLEDISRRFGLKPESICDFSSNILYPLKKGKLKKWVAKAIDNVGYYPDPLYKNLKLAISQSELISHKDILVGNGSTELLYLAVRALKPKSGLIIQPSYLDYEDALLNGGAKVVRFTTSAKTDFKPDLKELSKKSAKVDMVILGNPNNPTGSVLTKREILKLAKENKKTLFLIDEAFGDFIPDESVIKSKVSNVIVLKSLTKFYGIPGLRIGFITAGAQILKRIAKIQEPWTVNCIAEDVTRKILTELKSKQKLIDQLTNRRNSFAKKLALIGNLTVFPSEANFLLVEIGGKKITAAKLQKKLLERKILIRDCSNYKSLSPYYFRLAVRSEADNKMLIDRLKEVL